MMMLLLMLLLLLMMMMMMMMQDVGASIGRCFCLARSPNVRYCVCLQYASQGNFKFVN
jgi:hypothetical protein